MSEILSARLLKYQLESPSDEWMALREIVQELALAALSEAGFFKYAAFQGGTCLRIVHKLPRFSEDLDFALLKENTEFSWAAYGDRLTQEFKAFGLDVSIQDRSKLSSAVKAAFLKQDSVGRIISFRYPRTRSQSQTIRIKLEVDSRPPAGAVHETKMLDFPYPCAVTVHDLPSLFAGKCLALLCRNFVKGRDFFDLLWYLQNQMSVNMPMLQNGLKQLGPWKDQNIEVNRAWLTQNLRTLVEKTDLNLAAEDVRGFLRPLEERGLASWSKAYFLEKIDLWSPSQT